MDNFNCVNNAKEIIKATVLKLSHAGAAPLHEAFIINHFTRNRLILLYFYV